jgi:hypothetical protein
MFQIKNITRLFVIVTVSSLFLVACGGRAVEPESAPTQAASGPNPAPPDYGTLNDPPTFPSDPTNQTLSDHTPPESNEELPLPQDSFRPTAAAFLVDVSTSINELCEPEIQTWRTAVPEFFITYAYNYHYIERGRDEDFQIGWSVFPPEEGASFDLKMRGLGGFGNYSEWNNEFTNDLKPNRDGLGFADVLASAVEELNMPRYNDHQKVIFLISETYLSYTHIKDVVDEEKDRIIESLRNLPEGWQLYVVQLPCTGENTVNSVTYTAPRLYPDIIWWRTEIAKHAGIHLLDRDDLSGLSSVVGALFDHNDDDDSLKSLLPWQLEPGRHGWGWIDGQNVILENGDFGAWQTDGDMSVLNLKVVAINAHGFQLDPAGIFDSHYNPLLYTYSHERQNPGLGCPNYIWTLRGKDSTEETVGIFWWHAQYPSYQIEITNALPMPADNPQSLFIEASILGPYFKTCYKVQLIIGDESDLNNEDVASKLTWSDIPFNPSKTGLQFTVAVQIARMYSDNSVSQRPTILARSEQYIEVKFTPVLSGQSFSFGCPTCEVSRFSATTTVSMTFDYATISHYESDNVPVPQLFLLTDKSNDHQSTLGCTQENFPHGTVQPEHNDRFRWNAFESVYYAYQIAPNLDESSTENLARIINVDIPQTWLDYCAYTDLLLQWPEQISLSIVKCSLQEQACQSFDNLARLEYR